MRRRGVLFTQRFGLPLYTFDRESDTLVGECGLYGIDWGLPNFGLGYWCRSSRTGEGLTAEAVAAVTEWAFAELEAVRVELGCLESNTASRRIAEKCGFEFSGISGSAAGSLTASQRIDTALPSFDDEHLALSST